MKRSNQQTTGSNARFRLKRGRAKIRKIYFGIEDMPQEVADTPHNGHLGACYNSKHLRVLEVDLQSLSGRTFDKIKWGNRKFDSLDTLILLQASTYDAKSLEIAAELNNSSPFIKKIEITFDINGEISTHPPSLPHTSLSQAEADKTDALGKLMMIIDIGQNLEKINLDLFTISPNALPQILTALANQTSLKELKIDNEKLTVENIKGLADAMTNLRHLKNMELDAQFSAEALQKLAIAMGSHQQKKSTLQAFWQIPPDVTNLRRISDLYAARGIVLSHSPCLEIMSRSQCVTVKNNRSKLRWREGKTCESTRSLSTSFRRA